MINDQGGWDDRTFKRHRATSVVSASASRVLDTDVTDLTDDLDMCGQAGRLYAREGNDVAEKTRCTRLSYRGGRTEDFGNGA
jgi:hypothetical protein